jgi:hypothetical protein
LAAEDDLLLAGIIKFGSKNWASIRAYYLPTKTCDQIKIRINNLYHLRVGPNAVRNYLLVPFKPMTECERQILFWVIIFYQRALLYTVMHLESLAKLYLVTCLIH